MLPAATPNEISQLVYGLALDWRIGSGFQKKMVFYVTCGAPEAWRV